MYKVWIFAIFEKCVFVRIYATFASKNTPKKDRVYSIYPVQIGEFSTNFEFLPQNWFLRKKGKNKYEKKKNLQNFGAFKFGCCYGGGRDDRPPKPRRGGRQTIKFFTRKLKILKNRPGICYKPGLFFAKFCIAKADFL